MTTNKKIYLKDYSEPNFSIKNTKLLVEIFDDYTLVTSQLEFNKNNNKCSTSIPKIRPRTNRYDQRANQSI